MTLLALAAGLARPGSTADGSSGPVEFLLRSRDPNTGQARFETLELAPAKIGVIVMDRWNDHWCLTAAERFHLPFHLEQPPR